METEKERIEKIMDKLQLNATQFASEIGIKSPTLSHILNGRNNPSLDVLKRILLRYPNISSDWLILGNGPMLSGISQGKPLNLFDEIDTTDSKSAILVAKTEQKEETVNSVKQEKVEVNQVKTENIVSITSSSSKSVKKIIVYYDDNTFQEFVGK
ncbi:MAG TPA: helix-turn-helix transcriptional regulator [Bacteroidales bacterium]|nr:helix-turn-helix transcriptional regulator [Bacteroidales bacterium]